jgi:sugar/nucleoside kinase (ribokinase family)
MLHERGQPPRELNRLDIKNRTPTPGPLEDVVIEGLHAIWQQVDALIVLDQVSEEDCGAVTARVREELARLGEAQPDKFVLADSRKRIGLFRGVCIKPNYQESEEALYRVWHRFAQLRGGGLSPVTLTNEFQVAEFIAKQINRTVFLTLGESGLCLGKPVGKLVMVPSCPVTGPIDIVGAGDSTSSGITCAVAAGASYEQAAAFGCLVASITIQQIGTTGTASPEQVRQRWREVRPSA